MWPFKIKKNVYRKLTIKTDLYYGICGVKYETVLVKASHLNPRKFFKIKLPLLSVDIDTFTCKQDVLTGSSRIINIDLVEIRSNKEIIRLQSKEINNENNTDILFYISMLMDCEYVLE